MVNIDIVINQIHFLIPWSHRDQETAIVKSTFRVINVTNVKMATMISVMPTQMDV